MFRRKSGTLHIARVSRRLSCACVPVVAHLSKARERKRRIQLRANAYPRFAQNLHITYVNTLHKQKIQSRLTSATLQQHTFVHIITHDTNTTVGSAAAAARHRRGVVVVVVVVVLLCVYVFLLWVILYRYYCVWCAVWSYSSLNTKKTRHIREQGAFYTASIHICTTNTQLPCTVFVGPFFFSCATPSQQPAEQQSVIINTRSRRE